MNQFIFRSRWIALAFTGLTLFSVYMLVGGENEDSFLTRFQGDLVEQRDDFAEQVNTLENPAPPAPPMSEQPPVEYDDSFLMDDQELIDDASGFDPTPDGGSGEFGPEIGPDEQPSVARPEFINGIPVRMVDRDDR